ncbi:unnamed protein product [Adineta ricciae]|uniref:Uncharacterized protein n=1 Tax=Adineta ricciae TaxID=249248 RepID=A0A813PBA3_ADIRI|nr:unnamed protein product [Adineta ricciae]CAF0854658.1 unnamed protein product [Adineta ricciae]
MEPNNKDEILSNFIAITQCPSEEATRYLEAAQWNAQTAMEIFFDNGGSEAGVPIPTTHTVPSAANTNQGSSEPIASGGTGGYESDDESPMQSAIEESLRANASAEKSTGDTSRKPVVPPSRFGTIGGLQHEEEDSDEEGQAFYAGGSERSGQQIIGPAKPKNNDKNVTKIFESARKQGAMEADDDDDQDGHSSRAKKEKAFGGVGYSLGDDSTPSRTFGQPSAGATAAASNRSEQLPLRFYSNGFTIGDGELRKFDENKEFMDHIKRGEVPPELRSLSAGGRQVEVRLEDHRGEEYKPQAPQFKPFGGAGHMLGSPAPNVSQSTTTGPVPSKSSMASSSTTVSTTTDSDRLEKLAEQQLKSSSSSTTIRLRLPDLSTPVRIAIGLDRTLADVRKLLIENVPSLQSSQFEFIEPPSTKIKREDESKTVRDAKLTNATLAVRRAT